MRVVVWVLVILGGAALALLLPLPWPESFVGGHLVNAIDIAAPPERVFAYIATPANWPRFHRASRAVHGVADRTLAIGQSGSRRSKSRVGAGMQRGRRARSIRLDVGHSMPRRRAAAGPALATR